MDEIRIRGARTHNLKNISADLPRNRLTVITGLSGSGKSSLAMGILGLTPENTVIKGKVLFDNRDLSNMSESDLNRLRWTEMAIVFQKSMSSLSPVHKIRTHVEDIYRVHYPKASRKEIENRFIYLLELMTLPRKVYDLYPHQLSGGMIQRVSIALSLMHQPKLLIMDEATTALDAINQGELLDEIADMSSKINLSRIVITHDMSVVAKFCNKIAVMHAGELVEMGETPNIITKPQHPHTKALLQAYPGYVT